MDCMCLNVVAWNNCCTAGVSYKSFQVQMSCSILNAPHERLSQTSPTMCHDGGKSWQHFTRPRRVVMPS